jgi:hypothetical protein
MTIAALRAHATRNLAWAEDAPSELAKAAFLAKAEGFQARVAEILKRSPGLPALAAPEPDAAPAEVNAQAWTDDDYEQAEAENLEWSGFSDAYERQRQTVEDDEARSDAEPPITDDRQTNMADLAAE